MIVKHKRLRVQQASHCDQRASRGNGPSSRARAAPVTMLLLTSNASYLSFLTGHIGNDSDCISGYRSGYTSGTSAANAAEPYQASVVEMHDSNSEVLLQWV